MTLLYEYDIGMVKLHFIMHMKKGSIKIVECLMKYGEQTDMQDTRVSDES